MSVSIYPYLVEWPTLESRWAQEGASLSLAAAADDGEDWVQSYDDGWIDSWGRAIEFSDLFKQLRRRLPEGVAAQAEAAMRGFCLAEGDESFRAPQDLGPDVDTLALFATLRPETVRRYAEAFAGIDLDQLRRAFEAQPVPPEPFARFADVERYVAMWRRLFENAAKRGKGIAIVVA
jgi:hypothetical protein